MQNRLTHTFWILTASMLIWLQVASGDDLQPASSTCLQCHQTQETGFSPAHAFAPGSCITCHAGDSSAPLEVDAHDGLIAFPGELVNAQRTCGACHAGRVSSVTDNLMHTGRGMVHVTRQALDEMVLTDAAISLQSLGISIADSMLRKQCASCHIGQMKTEHRHDVMWDRGGGCLACHINDYPEDAHPALTARVSDARCFGCHSRSGRISLSYTGLAEIDVSNEPDAERRLRLPDGRHIERVSADAHYLAGMSCIDCHTSVGLMGSAGDALHQRQAVDISCADCHDNQNPTIGLTEWPAPMQSFIARLPFAANEKTVFLTTENNATPLWHVELRDDGAWLHTKNSGRELKIPATDLDPKAHDARHERLTCSACHSQWAPQCFGCHMEYDANGEQWDHVEHTMTPGRWSDERWHVSNSLPALGVNDSQQIEPFVPGMIMTIAHPALTDDHFVRMFAPLSPHTTGKTRSCVSCHRSSKALGLGQGKLTKNGGAIRFEPAHKLLRDGLPADAWTNIANSLGGRTPSPAQRPLNKAEIEAILDASIADTPDTYPPDR
jgi:hypothetical protein